MLSLPILEGFEWDKGNRYKNWFKHSVSRTECEQVFANKPITIVQDAKHSTIEQRYAAFGRTNGNRFLTIVFTVRNNLVRVISARDQKWDEREKYLILL